MTLNLTIISLKAAGLGAVLSAATMVAIYHPSQSTPAIYVASLCIFHLAEFFCTSIYNPTTVDEDSFILEDTDLLMVYMASLVEYSIRNVFISSFPIHRIGILIAFAAQIARSLAMCTAGESFHHYVQRTQAENHKLITNGIYAFCRHPSYFGFWWWFVGLEIWMGNPIVLLIGSYKLWVFFKGRIEFEEKFLIDFFGENYIDYKSRVGVYIPFIE